MTIEARNLSIAFGSKTVLQDVDLDLRPGECLGLIGPNGAGKTTLLRILAGLARPAAGTLRYDGQSAGALDRAAVARRIACLAQGAGPGCRGAVSPRR